MWCHQKLQTNPCLCSVRSIYKFNDCLSAARAFLEQSSEGNTVLTPHLASPNRIVESSESKPQNVNVLVTSGSLIPSLVKCVLFRLDGLITHQNGQLISLSFLKLF